MEAEFNVNALYLMAHAIHESGWGTSILAQTKHNLYGINAVDSDPIWSSEIHMILSNNPLKEQPSMFQQAI